MNLLVIYVPVWKEQYMSKFSGYIHRIVIKAILSAVLTVKTGSIKLIYITQYILLYMYDWPWIPFYKVDSCLLASTNSVQ